MADGILLVPGVVRLQGRAHCQDCGTPMLGYYHASVSQPPVYELRCQGDGCRTLISSALEAASGATTLWGLLAEAPPVSEQA